MVEMRDRDGSSEAPDEDPGTSGETKEERIGRELDELLQQLRIILPGVQILFAFLLTVPFTERFDLVDGVARDAFFVAFITTAAATALLIAPVAYARFQFRQYDKERLVRLGTVLAIGGLGLLAVSLCASTFVVTQVLFSETSAAIVASACAALFATMWFVVPLVARKTSIADR
jgi:hypothetical protein